MAKNRTGTVRIIGGAWRGTRLPVRDLPGLRPSGDRGRETLFNWLQPYIRGSRCADLFAGSGVLGLEAASRGAASVTLVERSKPAADDIRASLEKLRAGQVELVRGDALAWLSGCTPRSLDIVFVDPPFGAGLEERVLELLAGGECLADEALVYLETAREAASATPGADWETVKESVVGDVRMRLLKKA